MAQTFGGGAFDSRRERRQARRAERRGGTNGGFDNVFGGLMNDGNIRFNWNRVEKYRGRGANPGAVNPYFDPNHGYGSPWGKRNQVNAGLKTGLVNSMISQNPEPYYQLRLNQMGVSTDANTLMGRFYQNQFDQVYAGYQQALLRNPFLTFQKYFKTTGGAQQWQDRWQEQSAQARGENLGLTQGPARWQMNFYG